MTERNILVCGAGLHGHGIAQVSQRPGTERQAAQRAGPGPRRSRPRTDQRENLQRAVAEEKITDEKNRQEQLGRISVASDLAEAAASAKLIVEAVFEDEAVDAELFRDGSIWSRASQRAPY